jgi:hypothetical protein
MGGEQALKYSVVFFFAQLTHSYFNLDRVLVQPFADGKAAQCVY